MPADWGRALQVGGVGFAMVFAILILLYLVLGLMGRLGAMFSPAKASDKNKKPTPQAGEKRATIAGG